MAGSWHINVNGVLQKQYGQDGHVEGIELADIIWNIYGKMETGDKIEIVCELSE